jgi:uncharacterized membrane protein YfcA
MLALILLEDIKIITLISTSVGITRYTRNKMYNTKSEITPLVVPISIATIIKASIGAFLVIYAPSEILKLY